MLGFGKRLGAWALCICLLCTLPVVALAAAAEDCSGDCAHEAAIGTTHYDTIAEAFAAAEDGSTITVLTDLSAEALTTDKAITLDLGGMTVTGQNTAEEALVTATADLTVTNGTILTENGAVLLVTDAALIVEETAVVQGTDTAIGVIARSVDKEASATIRGTVTTQANDAAVATVSDNGKACNLYIEKPATISSKGNAVEMYDTGRLEITGGTITAKKNTVVLEIADNMTIDVSVTGGSFTAKKGELFVITAGEDSAVPEHFVTGGTFNKDPSDYVPETHDVRKNDDGTYTVISSYQITFSAGGAYGTMDAISVPCGESITLPQCGFTAEDHMEFAGWEIGGAAYAVGDTFTPVSDTVITALWTAHTHYGGYATCISPAICDGCGSAYGSYGSHDLTYVDGYAAGCDSTGMLSHTRCSYCGICFVDGEEISSFSLSIPALGHQWKDEKAKAATCTEAGMPEHRRCTTCGTIQVAGEDVDEDALVIPALGHTMKTIDAVQSTCTQAGVKAHSHCTTCGKYFLQDKEVDPAELATALASHVLGSQWITDETYHWKTCVDCKAAFRQHKHADSNADNTCDDCGYAIAASSQPVAVDATTAAAADTAEKEDSEGFSFAYLIPVFAAVVIALITVISVAVQKYNRRKRRKMRQMRKMQK